MQPPNEWPVKTILSLYLTRSPTGSSRVVQLCLSYKRPSIVSNSRSGSLQMKRQKVEYAMWTSWCRKFNCSPRRGKGCPCIESFSPHLYYSRQKKEPLMTIRHGSLLNIIFFKIEEGPRFRLSFSIPGPGHTHCTCALPMLNGDNYSSRRGQT